MKKIKNWFFKTCPRSGRIVGINKKNVVLKICFPLMGLTALIWFLIRVVPKPSRIAYPCQQVAAPLAFSFLAFFSSTLVGWGAWKKFLQLRNSRHFYKGLAVLFAGVLLSGTFYIMSVDNSLFGQAVGKQIDNGSDMGTFTPTDKPNAPMGVARGIHPGRVAWAHDPQAAVWDGKHGLYSDADNNSQTRVCDMMEGVIISLTHQKTIDRAWDELFRTFNKKKGKGATGYKEGEKIAIKVNLNDNGGSNIIDATPQSVYALLHQLVDIMNVPQHCITVYDAQRRGISAIYTYLQPVYPDVVYQNWGGFVPDVIRYSSEITDPGAMSLARAAYEADYMINMALMKRHSRPTDNWKDSAGQTGITATGKNHFGSIGNVSPLHLSIRDWSKFRGMGTYNSIVDLMAHERLGGNTLVYIVDAMYVNPIHNGRAVRFKRAPFNDGWTSSFLASNDQVAIESVVLDFIRSEMPVVANADNFMHEAANIGNPPSGIRYEGRAQKSLGVHEHWNNPDDRMYSRNLKTGKGIELYRVPLDAERPAIEYFYSDRISKIEDQSVTLYWKTSNGEEVLLNGEAVAANDSCVVKPETSLMYELAVKKGGTVQAVQKLVVRSFTDVRCYDVKEAQTEGSAIVEAGSFAEFRGEKGSSKGALTWQIDVPGTGKYYLLFSYSDGSPVPSYLYLNNQLVSENIGYLATSGSKKGEFAFPVTLTAGKNSMKLEHLGKRSNRIYSVTVAREKKPTIP